MKRTLFVLAVGVLMGVGAATYVRRPAAPVVPVARPPADTIAAPPQPSRQYETDPDVLTAVPPMDGSAPAGTPRYELEDAAARGLIEYLVRGNNGSSGEGSLILTVRRLTDEDIDVYIVPGTVFVPGNSSAQRMVAWNVVRGAVVREDTGDPEFFSVTSMYLPDAEVRVFSVEAYCMDFHLANPAPADVFSVQLAQPAVDAEPAQLARAEPDVRAAQLIYEGKKAGLSVSGIQVAIWSNNDHVSKQEIATKFTVEEEEMDRAFQLALEAPPPIKR